MSNRPHGTGFYQGPGFQESTEDLEHAAIAEQAVLAEQAVFLKQDSEGITMADSFSNPHLVEQNVWHALHHVEGGQFLSLTVRRLDDCVYLHGVLEVTDKDFPKNVDSVVKQVACVNRVLNHLVMLESHSRLAD
jgi:hypothetical protein